MTDRNCLICGGPLPSGSRQDRQTCSDVCRQRLSRHHRRLEAKTCLALQYIYEIATEAATGHFGNDAFGQLEYVIKYSQGVHADSVMGSLPRQWWTND